MIRKYRAWREMWRQAFLAADADSDVETASDRLYYAIEYVSALRAERLLIEDCRRGNLAYRARERAENDFYSQKEIVK